MLRETKQISIAEKRGEGEEGWHVREGGWF